MSDKNKNEEKSTQSLTETVEMILAVFSANRK